MSDELNSTQLNSTHSSRIGNHRNEGRVSIFLHSQPAKFLKKHVPVLLGYGHVEATLPFRRCPTRSLLLFWTTGLAQVPDIDFHRFVYFVVVRARDLDSRKRVPSPFSQDAAPTHANRANARHYHLSLPPAKLAFSY